MGGKRCTHDQREMIAYWAKSARQHSAAYWCPACGALGWIDYGDKLSDTKWQAPTRGAKTRRSRGE
jgi:hypothetical protein